MKKTMIDESAERRLNAVLGRCTPNFRPPEDLTVDEWADKYRMLSAEASAEAGRWRTSRTPYLREIMRSFTDPVVNRITMVSASQIGKSEAILNCIGYCIDQDPGSILFVQPTLDDAKKFSRLRVAPMIRDTARLRRKVADVKARASGNTMLQKEFPGGMLTITGANSPSALASTPARYIFGDERDRWPRSAGSEGDPWKLAEARQATFYNRKAVEVSTPTIKGRSNIEESYSLGTQERWMTRCPECGEYSEINWSRIKFDYESTKVNHKRQYKVKGPIYWVCEKCGCLVDETTARKQPCKWVASNPAAYEKGHRSFWLNAFVSPWTPWKKIVLEFLEAHEDPERLQVVFNTLLGLLWEQRGDLADEEQLLARREDYGKTAEDLPVEVPDGVLVLAAGWDTQDNRLEYEIVGYGHNNETWGIKKGFVMGEPNSDEVWRQFDDITDHVYRFKDGRGLKISITMVDSGGHYTDEVYRRCRQRKFKRVFAVKGQGGEGVPYVRPPSKVPVNPKEDKRMAKAFTWLYVIGVDAGKAALMTSLRVESPGPNYCHFPREESCGYNEDFFSGLLSEHMELEETRTGRRWAWVKLPGHTRNEALDCRNYANAGIRILQPDMFAVEKRLKETALREETGEAVQEEPTQRKRAQVPRQRRKSPVDKYFEEW